MTDGDQQGIRWQRPIVRQPKTGEIEKIPKFEIEKAERSNIGNWKHKLQNFAETQDCWEEVEYTLEHRHDPIMINLILAEAAWRRQNRKVSIFIENNVSRLDLDSIKDMKSAGEKYGFLLDKYDMYTEADVEVAISDLCKWQKDPNKGVVDSLQEIEAKNSY